MCKSGNTVLHLASRLGHYELVVKIVKFKPELVEAENQKLETPLHDACRQNNPRILLLFLGTNPWAVSKLNDMNQSALYVACSTGLSEMVKLLLNQRWLLDSEEDGVQVNSLQIAASRGHIDVIRMILKACPDFAQRTDKNGQSALHYACGQGHSTITKELLGLDTTLSQHYDNSGRTPLHLAAMNVILNEFVSMAPNAFQAITAQGETVFHLSVSAEDILSSEDLDIRTITVEGSDKRSTQRSSTSRIKQTYHQLEPFFESFHQRNAPDRPENLPSVGYPTKNTSLINEYKISLDENEGHNTSELIKSFSRNQDNNSPNLDEQKVLSRRHREELRKLHKICQSRQRDIHLEALQNARNAITVVAILIATVNFTASISPPGGLHQDGPSEGKLTMGKTKAFKVFAISNSIALFTSLCFVIILVSIIPFQRKPLMRLLVIAHKVMWVAVSFMATAFVAATCLILPPVETDWTIEAILSISVAAWCLMFLFLMVQLGRQWLRKLKWRKEKGTSKAAATGIEGEGEETHSDSGTSDVESSQLLGYHVY
ncbi:Ankyrin repeat [Dillenia turbinata]|uniref:Ankyrin repeat n=1 Tax=Dillenia turbinata TaxID=194707 RepID=A0AAN8UK66_9MAGN